MSLKKKSRKRHSRSLGASKRAETNCSLVGVDVLYERCVSCLATHTIIGELLILRGCARARLYI